MKNIITLDIKDDLGYIYIHRDTYDDAVHIDTNYYCKDVVKKLGAENNIDVINELEPYLDEKIRVLLGFLVLLDDGVFDDCETVEDKLDLAIGALHRMSMTFDLYNILNVPPEIRKTFKFSKSIKDEYKLSWDKFFKECLTYEEIVGALKENTLVPQVQYVIPVGGYPTAEYSPKEVEEEVVKDEFGLEDNSEELSALEDDISGGDPNFDWEAYYMSIAEKAGINTSMDIDVSNNRESSNKDVSSENENVAEAEEATVEEKPKRRVKIL